MAKRDLVYNSETGDIEETQQGPVAVDPLRVPYIVENFMAQYIPVEDERSATDVIPIGELRTMLNAWMGFGVKEDPLQEYLDLLAENGYIMRQTASGPALCLIDKGCDRVINSTLCDYEDVE